MPTARPDLLQIFQELNERHFDGFLEPPVLRWNSRIRTASGRFFPGVRKRLLSPGRDPVIEVASYLLEEVEADLHIRETIAHEMIHYWLWVRRRPYGHTDEFYSKMEAMGARRYNPVPRRRPHKYVYGCPHCATQFKSRRVLGRLACAKCCKSHSNGKYDERFRLMLVEKLTEKIGPVSLVLAVLMLGAFGGSAKVQPAWFSVLDGSRQCEPFKVADAEAALRERLKAAGIEPVAVEHVASGKPGEMRITLCGSPTGGRFRVRIVGIEKSKESVLLELGFERAGAESGH